MGSKSFEILFGEFQILIGKIRLRKIRLRKILNYPICSSGEHSCTGPGAHNRGIVFGKLGSQAVKPVKKEGEAEAPLTGAWAEPPSRNSAPANTFRPQISRHLLYYY